MPMIRTTDQISEWLIEYGDEENDGKTYGFTCTDKPWMMFAAELQRYEHHDLLMVSYYFEEDGDLCPDGEYWFTLGKNGGVQKIKYVHWLSGAYNLATPPELDDAELFAREVYRRHMLPRMTAEQKV